jgi:membrane protease YdiL (CAAX protease family)
MNNEEHKKRLAVNEKISTVILLFLLLLRLVDQYLPVWIFGTNIPNWYGYGYVGIAYILTVVIVGLNRHRLAFLNIDRPFVIALMIGGFLYLFYLPLDMGLPVVAAAGFLLWSYQQNHFVLENTSEYPSGTVPLIFISVFIALLPIVLFNPAIKESINLQLILASVMSTFQEQLALIAFEEVIFRGALWAYLRQLGLNEPTIFITQAFLFWVAHSRFILVEHATYSFWVATPLISLLLGLIAWRAKSLTPSTIAHFLFNSTIRLMKNLY